MTAAADRSRPRAVAPRRWLPHAVFAVGSVTIAVGLVVRRFTDTPIGLPWPPALGNPAPAAHSLLIASLALFAAAVALAPRLLDERLRPAAVAIVLLAATLLLRLALAAGRGGTGAWDRVFDESRSFEAANEYLPALPVVDLSPGFFVDRFAELVPSFPVHVAGHPPGLPLVMHALVLDTPARLAAFCIGVGALSAPLAYGLGREGLSETGARITGLLMALSPQALMFGVTTADAVYLTLGLLAAWPLARRSLRARMLGGVMLAAASLFAWSLLAVGAWAAILAWRRHGLRSALALAAVCGVVLLALHGAFSALTGFDPVGTLRAT